MYLYCGGKEVEIHYPCTSDLPVSRYEIVKSLECTIDSSLERLAEYQ